MEKIKVIRRINKQDGTFLLFTFSRLLSTINKSWDKKISSFHNIYIYVQFRCEKIQKGWFLEKGVQLMIGENFEERKKKWKCQPNRRYTGTLSVPFLSVAPGTVAARRAGTTWIRGISRITRTFADTAWPAWRNSLLLAIIATDRLVASPKTRVPTPNIGEWFFNRQIPRASNGILGSSSVLTIDDSFDRSKSKERKILEEFSKIDQNAKFILYLIF